MTDIRKYAIYVRLSLDDGDIDGEEKQESNSITAQRNFLLGYLKREFSVEESEVLIYCDDGYTGTNFERPSFKQLLNDIRAEWIQCLVVKDFSRLGRDYIEVGNLMEFIFPLMQVRFISVNDGYDSKEKYGSTGGMPVGLQNLVYSMYSKDLSQKVKSAKRTRQLRGEYMAGVPRFGYEHDPMDKHKLIIDEEAAQIVRRIFELAASGKSSLQICRIFNAEGVLTCTEYHRKKKRIRAEKRHPGTEEFWQSGVVRNIIRDEIYLGNMVSNKRKCGIDTGHKTIINDSSDWIVVKGTHEPIVTQEIFDKANASIQTMEYEKKPQRKASPLFICGKCGRAIVYRNTGNYYCRTSGMVADSECRCIKGKISDIEEAVLQTVISTAGIMDSVKRKNQKTISISIPTQLNEVETALKRVAVKKMDYYNAYKDGRYSREEFVRKNEELRKEGDKLNVRKQELEELLYEQQRKAQEEESCVEELEAVTGMTEFDRDLIQKMVDKVIIHAPDNLEIVWKFDDWYMCDTQ